MVSVLASRTEDCGFEQWSITSSVVLQVWLACSPPEQMIVGSSHGPTHHRWCYRYGQRDRLQNRRLWVRALVQHIIGGVTGMVSVLASRTDACGFEPWPNTSSVVLQVWLACSPPEQMIAGSSHGPTHHRWCYRYGQRARLHNRRLWVRAMVQHIIGGVTGMVSVLASRTDDCGFEPWSNTSSVVLQVWLACSPPEQKIVGSSHGPTHHRWCYRYGQRARLQNR